MKPLSLTALRTEKQIDQQDAERFRKLAEKHQWKFAKTYASFLPHGYTLRDGEYGRNGWNSKEWEFFALHIWRYGVKAHFGRYNNPYYVDEVSGYYYWIFPEDVDESTERVTKECYLINRAKIEDYDLFERATLLDTERWIKVKPKARREESK